MELKVELESMKSNLESKLTIRRSLAIQTVLSPLSSNLSLAYTLYPCMYSYKYLVMFFMLVFQHQFFVTNICRKSDHGNSKSWKCVSESVESAELTLVSPRVSLGPRIVHCGQGGFD